MSSPNQAGVYAVSVILGVASLTAVGLRFYARRLKAAAIQSDDLLALASMLLVWALAIILIVGTARGTLGTHTALDPNTGAVVVTWHENDTSLVAGISQLLTVIALGTLKSSVVLLYRRVFIGAVFSKISLVILIAIVLWTIAFFFATLFECGRDFSLLWQTIVTFKTYCQRYKQIQLGHAASDVATDLVVLSLPLPIIWRLHMSMARKISLSLIFLLGLLSTAAGTARLVVVAEDIYETTAGSRDVRGVETNAMVWSFVEVAIGTIAACLPTLKPVINSRTPESIVNSVRSKVSLGSTSAASSKRHGPGSEPSIPGAEDYEMLAPKYTHHEGGAPVMNEIEATDGFANEHTVPKNKILMQNDVTVEREQA